MIKVELLREGGSLDEFSMTLVLENRIAVPVRLRESDGISVTSVRETGQEMPAGYVTLPETYEVPSGRTVFTDKYPLDIFHGYGSPVSTFKLSPGQIGVSNSDADINERSLFCDYRDVTVGKPLQGSWGS